jgi:hypothetical protein
MSLEQIEDKLSECYKTYKPVLLHGTNNIEHRVELIKKFWIQKCGGVGTPIEFFLEDISMPPKTSTNWDGLSEKYESTPGDSKDVHEFVEKHTRVTDKTWRYFDAGRFSGKEVYEEMVLEIGDKYEREKYLVNRDIDDHQGNDFRNRLGYFHACNGLIFLDNLDYKKKDDSYYLQLAYAIKNFKKEGYVDHIDDLSKHGLYKYKYDLFFAIRWLVAFTHDTEAFPLYFLEQFKLIPLDSKDCNVKEEGIVGADKAKAIESGNKQTNAKKDLPKKTEYIRFDEDDESFYAKAKDKKDEKQLKLTGQPLALLHHLFNEYDSKSKKASVPIDEILSQVNILEHKRGDNISGDKISQLHVKVKAVRDELKSAGFSQAKIIKTMKESGCELYIECSSD